MDIARLWEYELRKEYSLSTGSLMDTNLFVMATARGMVVDILLRWIHSIIISFEQPPPPDNAV